MSSEAAAYFPDALASRAEKQTSVRDDLRLSTTSEKREQPGPEIAKPLEVLTVQTTETDEALLEQVSRGAREALGLLFRRHARSVRNVAQRILRDEAEADDLLQDVFLFIFRKAALFDSRKGSARSWIFQVAYHRAFNRRHLLTARDHYLALQLDEEILGPAGFAAETPNGSSTIDGIFGRELLAKCKTYLSSEQMRTLELFFFEGYTLKEISELTGQSLSNVRSYYYRGLERLRSFVTPEKARTK